MNSLIIHTACRASNKMSSNNNLEFTSLREQLLNERSRKEILDFHYKVWRQIENSKSLHMNYKKLKELVNPHLITIIYKGGIFLWMPLLNLNMKEMVTIFVFLQSISSNMSLLSLRLCHFQTVFF